MDGSQEIKSLRPIDSRPEKKKPGSRITEAQVHKCNLDLPNPVWEELQSLADANYTTTDDLIIRFAKLGLMAAVVENFGGYIFIHRPGLPDQLLNVSSLL